MRSATPLWIGESLEPHRIKAPSPLRSAGALHILLASHAERFFSSLLGFARKCSGGKAEPDIVHDF